MTPTDGLEVLFVGPSRSLNPDCTDLAAALRAHPGVARLAYGTLSFWHGYRHTDIVHLHFPELLTGYREPGPAGIAAVRNRCRWWRAHGATIVVTLHTWTPHGRATPAFAELYRTVFEHADVVVHFGPATWARAQDLGWAPTARHEVVPHHVLTTFGRPADRDEARRSFDFTGSRPLAVVAQTLRSTDEVDLVGWAHEAGVRVLFAGAVQAVDDETVARVTSRRAELVRRPGVYLHDGFVPDGVLRRYVTAADLVFLARVDPCNSSGVALGAGLGRVVVGPDVGNVGCSLAELGHPRFDPTDRDSVVQAVQAGVDMARADAGATAAEHAWRCWGPDVVSDRYVELYRAARA